MPDWLVQMVIPSILVSLVAGIWLWYRKIYNQGKINDLNSIQLNGQKIQFQNKTEKITDLVDDFNRDHGPGTEDDGSGNNGPAGGKAN